MIIVSVLLTYVNLIKCTEVTSFSRLEIQFACKIDSNYNQYYVKSQKGNSFSYSKDKFTWKHLEIFSVIKWQQTTVELNHKKFHYKILCTCFSLTHIRSHRFWCSKLVNPISPCSSSFYVFSYHIKFIINVRNTFFSSYSSVIYKN